jgi:signal transduction histidine kinase
MMQTLRVLVVDDELGMRMAVARVLGTFAVHLDEEIGGEIRFEAQTAESGEEAMALMASQGAPDLLLLDIKMPGISGLEVLARMNERNLRPLTVMITAYATLETAIDATKRGAHDFLPKPFTPDELRVAVRRAVKHLMVQRQAQRLSEEKRQVRFQFISVLGHELKAPLAAIEGYLQILRDGTAGQSPATIEQVVQRALVRAHGMRKLISDLLDLTRIESGQKRREFGGLNLREIAQGALDGVTQAAGARAITLALHAPERVPVVADRGEMEIIFNNLVSNAVKYNRDGGRVDVTIEPDDAGRIRIAVADTGIGLTKEDASRLFQEFVRIKNDRTRAIAGTGLGLSIVRKLAQLYQGDATVESEPGVGSTFMVTLDVTTASPAAAAPASGAVTIAR